MNFTPAQKAAIDTKDCSLLVAAGAGSGKTRVLTERIVERLLDKERPTDITRFLIVTFTNAAAKELAERIRRALTEKSVRSAEPALVKNLALLPQAKICTIDAFCYDFVKEHFQKLGLPPRLRIAEETEIDVLLNEIIDTIIEEKMEASGENSFFLTVYDTFSGRKSDAPFAETVKSMYRNLVNLPSPKRYLEDVRAMYGEFDGGGEIFDTRFGKILKDHAQSVVQKAIRGVEDCLDASEFDGETYAKFEPLFENDIEELKNLLSSVESGYDPARTYFSALKFGSCRITKLSYPEAPRIYARRKKLLDAVKALKEPYFSISPELFRLCAADCRHIADELAEILLTVDERLGAIKRSYGMLDFSDVERMTLALLYDDAATRRESELASIAARAFDELYIDEYQDINPVQDLIFLALSRKTADGTECGRFLVGDAKQSIYGFRGANPGIFVSYRDGFSDVSVPEAPRRRLFMSHNFRCAENVVDFTNALFSRISADYGENEKLVYAKNEVCKVAEPVHMLFCNTDGLASHLAPDRLTAEAQTVYDEISRLLADPDAKNSDGERYTLSDIAVLTGKWDAARVLERFFAERGVPVVCEKGESFFERREIRLALNLLTVVDNPEKDIPLAGVMRSPVGGFDDDELVCLRLFCRSSSLYGACVSYAKADETDNEALIDLSLRGKTRRFLTQIDELRALSRQCSVSEFLRRMYARTDLAGICAAGLAGDFGTLSAAARRKNLMLLYDKARDFDKTMFRGLSPFLEYIQNLRAGGDMKSCADASGGIRIMTVHKSKGLEFPVCFLFNADRRKSAPSSRYLMSQKYGVAFKLGSYPGIRSVGGENGFVTADTPFRALLKQKMDEEETEEYKRLLYVALTRARDRLYITASPDKYEKTLAEIAAAPGDAVESGGSFFDWIAGFAAEFAPFSSLAEHAGEERTVLFPAVDGRTLFDVRTVVCKDEPEVIRPDNALPNAPEPEQFQPDAALLARLRTSLSARKRRLASFVAVPPKLTVSLLKEGLLEYEDAALAAGLERQVREIPEFIRESDGPGAAEKGTATHMFMQFADFAACEAHGCEVEAERLAQDGFLTEAQRGLLDTARLDAFFSTPLYRKIRSARRVYRELRFNLRVAADEVLLHVPQTSDFVLVQGVIDCFMENDDGSYTVMDFKTDRVSREGGGELLRNRYAGQLAFYCRAVEDMTKRPVSEAVIFSFHLMEEIPVPEALNRKEHLHGAEA